MKLSKKTDYALRAIVHLAKAEPDTHVSVREIAQQNDVPRRFLENIMLEMREAGWVKSIQGRDGGYFLAKSPADITMGEIVHYFDGVLSPVACLSTSEYTPCSQEDHCQFRRVLLEMRDQTLRLMEGASIATVLAGQPVTRDEIFRGDLMGGMGI